MPIIKDSMPFLYLDMARIEQSDFGIKFMRNGSSYNIEVSTLAALLLGPGVSITTAAIKTISNSGCMLGIVKKDLNGVYVIGRGRNGNNKNSVIQAKAFCDSNRHNHIIEEMYKIRFKDPNLNWKNLGRNKMMLQEGRRTQKVYKELAENYNLVWNGRQGNIPYENQDSINKTISKLNSILLDIVCLVLVALGFNLDLGFLHNGQRDALALDIVDIYKWDISVPLAFKLCSEELEIIENPFKENYILSELNKKIHNEKLLKRIPQDLNTIFTDYDGNFPKDVIIWNENEYEKIAQKVNE